VARRMLMVLTAVVLVSAVGVVRAGDAPAAGETASLMERDTLTGNWFGLGEIVAPKGLSVALGVTQVYQANVHGGLSTRGTSDRYSGSYDLELELDLEALVGLTGGTAFLLAEGSWRDGIGESAVGSLFGVNDDAGGDRAIDVTELWYEQALLDGALRVRLGKINLTGGFECRGCPVAFDGNAFANDETAQFLNGALVGNPTIPFPDNGLGVVVYVQPLEWLYVAGGVADADADARETGFNTAFSAPDNFFTVVETGVAPLVASSNGPLPGAYRVGLWYDPQPKERLDGTGEERDDLGFYLSLDQMLWRENADEDDSQGLGLFARYGLADDKVNEVCTFWSVGAQYQGLVLARDEDILGFGVAQGRLSSDADVSASHETVFELYYNAIVAPWLSVSPSVQMVLNPGGDDDVNDAVVLGVRVQVSL